MSESRTASISITEPDRLIGLHQSVCEKLTRTLTTQSHLVARLLREAEDRMERGFMRESPANGFDDDPSSDLATAAALLHVAATFADDDDEEEERETEFAANDNENRRPENKDVGQRRRDCEKPVH